MKNRLLYIALTMTFILVSVTGCSIVKTESTVMQEKSTTKNDIQEQPSTQENEAKVDNLEKVDSQNATDTIQVETEETIEIEVEKEPLNQTPFVVSEDHISGYHDLITDVSSLNLDLDLSDPRLSELIQHLSTYTYNMTINQIGEITVPDSLYVLANKLNHLPENYVPENIRVPDIRFSITEYDEKKNLRDEPATALEALFNEAKNENLTLFAISGYRSYNRQKTIYNYKVDTRGVEESDKVSARPGHSEHQTGLAMDISCESVGYGLEYSFGDTPEGIWVASHAHDYGFIIRYPEESVDITGYNYEPWHLRYIGNDVASYLYENNLTIEELYSSILNQL